MTDAESQTQLEFEVPPDPSALIESMRAFGYSLPTAVADLIDNSITAAARTINVDFNWRGADSTLAVIDDGAGMNAEELLVAMRLGSRSPIEKRAANDLGRFGLGLKSAGWSQARSLTVITRRDGGPVLTRRWDLDHVTATGRWSLLGEGSAGAAELATRIERQSSGTAVLLEKLDRLVGDVGAEDDDARDRFLGAAAGTQRHLGMVFHRFLVGREPLTVSVNDVAVEPWDPFLEDLAATQRLPEESLTLDGRRVEIAPFVLPHVSKLTPDLHGAAAGVRGWNAQQGFYIYRARRLLVAGDWLGLRRMQQEEHYKLARIRIDLDNSADELWQIDVRKASARIPGPLQAQLRRIAETTRRRAAEAYRFRGKLAARSAGQEQINFVWERFSGRNGVRTFRVNRRHPVIQTAEREPESANAVSLALRLVEENLPVEAIIMENRENPNERPNLPYSSHESEISGLLRRTHQAMIDAGTNAEDALRALSSVEPFDSYPELLEVYREELRQ